MASKVMEAAQDFTQGPRELQLTLASSMDSGEKNETTFLLIHQDSDAQAISKPHYSPSR